MFSLLAAGILLLSIKTAEPCAGFKYHGKDGFTIAAEEQAVKDRLEAENESGELRCRDCSNSEEESEETSLLALIPLLVFSFIFAQEDTDKVPCCDALRLSNATSCGVKGGELGRTNTRILGGGEAEEHEFPWHCALLKDDGSYWGCGAVLLSCDPVVVVTAAHCFVRDANPEHLQVACGAYKIGRPGPSPLDKDEVRMQVTEIIRHRDFRWLTIHSPILGDNQGHPSGIGLFENDIAVLKVEPPEGGLQCQKQVVWPACLPNPVNTFAGWSQTGLAGWGLTSHQGNLSKTLLKVQTPIATDNDCRSEVCVAHLGPLLVQNCLIADSKICAGGVPQSGPCNGDSGGALLAQDDEGQGWAAVGLVSYMPGDVLNPPRCGSDLFTVFTEISKFLDWIAQQYGMLPPLR